MTSMFRTTALAAAMAASFSVLATPVMLDLTALGAQALGDPPGSGAPVPVVSVQGFEFSGNAFAYHAGMLKPMVDLQAPSSTVGAFIMNADRSTMQFSAIEINLSQALTDADRFFQSVTLSVFSTGNVMLSWSSSTSTTPNSTGDIGLSNAINGEWNTVMKGTPWDATDEVDRIKFFAGSGAYFGMQGMQFSLTGTGNPNPVPEPGSYALIGLALLAAGAATRRRA